MNNNPKLFNDKHSIELIDQEDGQRKLIHSKRFPGILVWLILKFIGDETEINFKVMNKAPKDRAETEYLNGKSDNSPIEVKN